MSWRENEKTALHWHYETGDDTVRCTLCPHNCNLGPAKTGLCGVRKRSGNSLVTMNYGYCIAPTIETIETEAVYHFEPGARILNMGNIGCNLKCGFCQNWQSSQVQFFDESEARPLSPEQTVELALANGNGIISWTYNDPVVWHEFVVETSGLARENGLITLYKSALHINRKPLDELIECIDIFSISLKTTEPRIFRRVMKGSLEPVLEGIKAIRQSGKHLELSQLIVTGMNDSPYHARATVSWIADNLGTDIPLHFVGYHPAYNYQEQRTSIETIEAFCDIAKQAGIRYCYSGNVIDHSLSNTICANCGNMLIERKGSHIEIVGLNDNSECVKCLHASPIIRNVMRITPEDPGPFDPAELIERDWEDYKAFHLVLAEDGAEKVRLRIEHLPDGDNESVNMSKGLRRILISRKSTEESRFRILLDSGVPAKLLPVLDRAHFPFGDV